MEGEIKKEIQGTIIPVQQNVGKATEEEFITMLKMIAPGTNLRSALDGALKAGKGALLVIENDSLFPLMDGGFRVNCRFTPQKLVELTKMDGAITLSSDLKRITNANVLLTPDSKIKSAETGTRHKAAERTSKQISGLVIAISERKREITVFFKNIKYHLKETDEVLRKASIQMQFLEKQREIFDKITEKLTKHEIRNYPSLNQAIKAIQKGKIIQKIADEMKKHVIELGNEGILLKTRLKEVILGVEKETNLMIKDYTKLDQKKSKTFLDQLTYEDLTDEQHVLNALAYDQAIQSEFIKGWRILSKTTLQESEIASLLKEVGSLGKVLHSNYKTYLPLLGEDKARNLKEELERLKLNS